MCPLTFIMRIMKTVFLILFYLLAGVCIVNGANKKSVLWYDTPADEWMKSLPIGNGRLAAMVYGGIDNETIALNESSMWAGEYDEHQEQPFGKVTLHEMRKLFFD